MAEDTGSSTLPSVVILARGLGTRMRKADPDAVVESDQAAVADAGVKGMIPIGRPFLDYVLGAIADAGYERVCLVIGPEHEAISDHYTRVAPPSRLSIDFAVQEKPLGTADAVLAAEEFTRGAGFVVLNSDNYYPVEALARLRTARPPALIGFARKALIERGNVAPDRAGRFGALEIDDAGHLLSITPRQGSTAPGEVYASMNCWLFDSRIFDACRTVPVSPRGELELTRAVQMAVDSGLMKIRVITMDLPVLDLSSRADIPLVAERLEGIPVSY
ncbi:MAG: sugar phosphate nucleotidyltransferase [Gemmatimonadaceae bacterium]